MPASSFDVYHIQNTKIDFNTTRPSSLGSNENEFLGQCQPIHISTNRYYGFHHTPEEIMEHDCEMTELQEHDITIRVPNNARKRSAAADDVEIYQSKRVREAAKKIKNIKRETIENKDSEVNDQELLETLYWNIHGGQIFHLSQCQ